MSNILNKKHPKLFDEAVGYIQQSLGTLPYLDNIFGISERTVKIVEGRRYFTPCWYTGRGEYVGLLPDDKLGNYAFFTLDEPFEVVREHGLQDTYTSDFNIIVWIDTRRLDIGDYANVQYNGDYTVGTFDNDRNRMQVLKSLMAALDSVWMKRGSFSVGHVYEKAENVFQGYTTDEVDNQYFMQPYIGFRIHGELTIIDECNKTV